MNKKLNDFITPGYNEFKELKGKNVVQIFYNSLLSLHLWNKTFSAVAK
jgi:hypothetical protein